MTGKDQPHGRIGETVALLAVLALSLALRALVADLPLERDEGQYGYIAWRWLDGALPYVDSFDQKPPATYAVYALAFSLFGVSAKALHWAAGLYTLATLAVLYALGRALFSPAAGLVAAAFLGFLVVEPSFLGSAANTETLLLLPMVAGFLATVRAAERRSVALSVVAGALGALACLFKQVAAFNLLYCGLVVVFWDLRRPSVARGVALAAGAALPVLATLWYFAAQGALQPFLDHVLWHNLGYSGRLPLAGYPASFWATFRPSVSGCGGIYALALGGLALAPPPREAVSGARDPRLLLLGWLAFSLLGVSVGGYFRHHYFLQAAPAVAVLAGAGAVAFAQRALPERLRGVGVLAFAAVALGAGLLAAPFYFFHPSPAERSRALYESNPFAESPAVARLVAERTRPEETIFVFGSEPQIPLLAGRRSASRYILVYPLFGPYPDARERQEEALAEILAARPAVIVATTVWQSFLGGPDAPDVLPKGLIGMLRREYVPVAKVPIDARDDVASLRPEDGEALWAASPQLSDPRVWGSLVVFERRDRAGGT